MTKSNPHPAPLSWMIGVALAQGFALYGLYQSIGHNVWPATDSTWLLPLFTVSLSAPVIALLSMNQANLRALSTPTAAFVGVISLCALYTGWMIAPNDVVEGSNIYLVFTLSMLIATFKGIMYIQQRANHQPLTYQLLFTYSWRNFLTTGLSLAFVGSVALILFLWARLFAIIGVEFFTDLFWNDWFLFPVLSVAFGVGISIFRNLSTIIDSITRLLEGLIRLLLPLIALVALLFLLTLPLVGLQPLWDTGNGTALLLWLTALMLFFVNAVYQSGEHSISYPPWVQTLVCAGLLTLPVFSLLSFYGLFLRIQEYGWTVGRCWGMVVWAILFAFSAGYTYGIVRRRFAWPAVLAQTNTYMGWAIVALMVLVNSPALDFRKITLASQIERVTSGEIGWHDFDFYYSKHYLGRPGYEHRKALKIEYADDGKLLALIEQPARRQRIRALGLAGHDVFDKLTFHSEPFEIPDEVKTLVRNHAYAGPDQHVMALQVDLTKDARDDIVIIVYQKRFIQDIVVAYQADHLWRLQRFQANPPSIGRSMGRPIGRSVKDLERALREQVSVEPSAFDTLRIGPLEFQSRGPAGL